MQASQRLIHRKTLCLSSVDARESSLDLRSPMGFSIRLDLTVEARR